jgi:hypothetical protein
VTPTAFRLSLALITAALTLPPPSLFAAETPPATVAEAAEMMISAGRLGVMLDHADASMRLHAGRLSEDPVETPSQQQMYAVHELRAAVLRYNTMLFDACRGKVLTGELCAQAYLPEWLKEPPDTVPPTAVLASRVQEAVNRIMPFWQAMCSRAVAQTRDETFCAIE